MTLAGQTTEVPLRINGRSYRWPQRPAVVICFDGCDPDYIDAARAAGAVPVLDRMVQEGFSAIALAAMPTFTNPNNISIVTGVPPAVHGVSGNFYLDRETGQTEMMTDGASMRAPTILAGFARVGVRVAAITAKDKLRKALGRDLQGISFSAEAADACIEAEHGIADVTGLVGRPAPNPYSADLSLFVLDAGVRLLEQGRAELLYLSLSDYVQHMHAPGTPEANAFMSAVDARLARLTALGAVVGIVADHGMSDMAGPDGVPNVLFLGDHLDAAFGTDAVRVICPITDPYVRHHGALGGFVRLYVQDHGLDPGEILAFVRALPQVDQALPQEEACARFALPPDREGDVVVIASAGVAIGARSGDHDLSQLAGTRLRSHGGLAERSVPFIVSEQISAAYAQAAQAGLNNYDIFDAVLNWVEGS